MRLPGIGLPGAPVSELRRGETECVLVTASVDALSGVILFCPGGEVQYPPPLLVSHSAEQLVRLVGCELLTFFYF